MAKGSLNCGKCSETKIWRSRILFSRPLFYWASTRYYARVARDDIHADLTRASSMTRQASSHTIRISRALLLFCDSEGTSNLPRHREQKCSTL